MSNRPAIVLTAYNRPELLRSTLDSWSRVRGIRSWEWIFSVEPSPQLRETLDVITSFSSRNKIVRPDIIVNAQVLGVLEHPYVALDSAFRNHEFVVRAEDDLVVADDILEYFSWAAREYRQRSSVATVHGYTDSLSDDPAGVVLAKEFNPWIWGTWWDRWKGFIGPTWDHDYSTFNETPGHQSGWDWNLDTRIFPARGLRGIHPRMSRVHNIGMFGTHSTPDNWRTAPSFQSEYGLVDYRES